MTNFFRLKSSDSDYHRLFRRNSIEHFKVYAGNQFLIGEVADTWVDDAGRYYLVVDRNPERHDSRVLVPLDRFQMDDDARQIHTEFDAAQISTLPIVTAEGTVRSTGHTVANQTIGTPIAGNPATVRSAPIVDTAATVRTYAPLEASSSLESTAPLDVPHPDKDVQRVVMPETRIPAPAPIQQTVQQPIQQPIEQPRIAPAPAAEVLATPVQPVTPARTPARIAQEEKIRLMEERLVVNARRQKVGEVIMRKEVITEMVQVPVRREKLIVEQLSPQRRQLVEVDLSQGDRTIELIESLNAGSNLTGSATAQPLGRSNSTNGIKQGSVMSIQDASRLLAELVNRPEYRDTSVSIEFADPRLQADYQHRSQQL